MTVQLIKSMLELQQNNASLPNGWPADEKAVIPWLLKYPKDEQAKLALDHFHRLLYAAAQPRHVSGNSCLKLCYYVDLCRKSASQELIDMIYSRTVCMGLFTFFVELSEKSLHRSIRQVIELVTSLLEGNPDPSIASTLKSEMLDRGMFILLGNASQPLVKPAFKALDHMVGKQTISVSEVLDSYKRQSHDVKSVGDNDEVLLAFVRMVFSWMADIMPDTAPSAGRFLASIAARSSMASASPDTMVSWSKWIKSGLSADPNCLENVKNYLLTPLFKMDKVGALQYLRNLSASATICSGNSRALDIQASLLLVALDVGKQCGLIVDADVQGQTKKETMALPEKLIGQLFGHPSGTVRSASFSVLTHSTEATRPFSASALCIFRANLGILYSDTDAKFRTEILSNTRIMIERLRGSNSVLLKKVERKKFLNMSQSVRPTIKASTADGDFNADEEVIDRQNLFLEWFMDFLLQELVPTASYQRHITSLKAIHLLATTTESRDKSISTAMDITRLFDKRSIRLLLDLVMDPFEDVRAIATTILKIAPSSVFYSSEPLASSVSTPILSQFLVTGDELSKRTGRADYADGVARIDYLIFSMLPCEASRIGYIHHIVDELQTRVDHAQDDIADAVQRAPVHGLFAALRLLWEAVGFQSSSKSSQSESASRVTDISEWRGLQGRLISCCISMWDAVEAILCDDSPEGHVLAEIEDVDMVDTKDVLSYSFRAIHESSNLLRTLLNQRYTGLETSASILLFEQFEQIGNLTYQQLRNLRHRGAFSTVTLTFARCCQLTQSYTADEADNRNLLEEWYHGTIACINEQVSTTRRSAGIPALMTGILSARSADITLDDAMKSLIAIAQQSIVLSEKDETNLPQVHAMNCIKDIFKSAALGKRAELYISSCLELAANALQSEIWAIRNCGLILLRSLIDALFGTTESKLISEAGWDGHATRLSFDRYPALPNLLLDLLRRDLTVDTDRQIPQIGAIESVFPALDILRRAGPPERLRDEFYVAISEHLGSKIWHVRDIAARTICTLHLTETWHMAVAKLIRSGAESNNRCHGVMMAVKYILERRRVLGLGLEPDSLLQIMQALEGFDVDMSYSGDALGAICDVKNTILELLLEAQRQNTAGFEDLEEEMILSCARDGNIANNPTPYTALQVRAESVRSMLIAALYDKASGAKSLIETLSSEDPDTACYCLQQIPRVWRLWQAGDIPDSELLNICDLFETAMRATENAQVHSLCLEFIADILDHYPGIASTMDLSLYMTRRFRTPDLSNAEIRISGFVISRRADDEDKARYDARLIEWGHMLELAGKATSDFDTRYAAVMALRAFYGKYNINSLANSTITAHMPALLACYDVLNDDDDELRELGGEITSKIIGRNLVSLAAKDEFLTWLGDNFGCDAGFASTVFRRVTGNLNEDEVSVKNRLSLALVDDDSLFVEEEQNLYVDEVRESIAWCSLIKTRRGELWDSLASRLQNWAILSLQELQVLVRSKDGIYGRVSKPAVYAICNAVVQVAASLMAREPDVEGRNNRSPLEEAIRDLSIVDEDNDFHPLLLSILKQSLARQ